MATINTAERVSAELSDNFVFQRSRLAYHAAAERIAGEVLEIGTGSGYGIEIVAPRASRFVTVDKHIPDAGLLRLPNVTFRQCTVPPLDFPDGSFDCVISFQVQARRSDAFVTLDNRNYPIPHGATFSIRRAEQPIFLAVPHNISFYDTLRNKMMWGIDIRG